MKKVLLLVVALFVIGCSDEKSVDAQEEISQSIDKIAEVVKKESTNISKSVEKATHESVEKIKEEAKNASQTVLKETKKVAQKTVTSIDKVIETPTKEVKTSTVDGATLFSKCSSCHGSDASKKALNKSQSIKGWSVEKITTAINGYKDGSYGGSMKGVMKSQVSKLSSDEIEALSKYISNL